MKYFANLVILIGFCIGTLGAAGFHSSADSANASSTEEPAIEEQLGTWEKALVTEDKAKLFFGVGLALLVLGGVLTKRINSALAATGSGKASSLAQYEQEIENLQGAVSWLDQHKDATHREQLHEKISQLLDGPYDELTLRSDELAAMIGFDAYAKVWSGVATCERLLNRAWSMLADNHEQEAKDELPLALDAIREARSAMAQVTGSEAPGDPPPTFEDPSPAF